MSTKFWKRPAVFISILVAVVLVAAVLVFATGGKATSKPTAPQSVSATAAKASAMVSWSAPSSDGGAPITSYVATSHPANKTCTTAATTCTISGLANGTSYTFTVTALNRVGASASSTSSNNVIPMASIVSPPSLTVQPSVQLTKGATVKVSGANFTPNDQVFLVECLVTASGQGGCDSATATPVTITAAGVLPSTTFKVTTGTIGSGTCGTTTSNLKSCAISAGNASGGDTAAAPIAFQAPAAKATTTTKAGKTGTSTTTTKPKKTTTTTTKPKTTTTTAPASNNVAFTGSYSGTFTVLIVNNNSTSGSATVTSLNGSGTGTDLGSSTLSGSGQVPTTATNSGFSFTGSGSLSGSGSTLTVVVVSSSANVPDGAGTGTLSGVAKITGGTGKFAGATGSLKFSGSFNLTGIDSGTQTPAFTSTLSGTINL
jgi:hypothetical protein